MAELKTKPTGESVSAFIERLEDDQKRRDAHALLELMTRATGVAPEMWGPSIVGFGRAQYKYASGRELDWFPVGFSPRSSNLTLYLMGGFEPYTELLDKLGPHKLGKGCLYLKGLKDVDLKVLRRLVAQAYKRGQAQRSA